MRACLYVFLGYMRMFSGVKRYALVFLSLFGVWGCVPRCKKVHMHICRSFGYARVFVSLLGYAIVFANDVGIRASTSQHLQTLLCIPKTCKMPAYPKRFKKIRTYLRRKHASVPVYTCEQARISQKSWKHSHVSKTYKERAYLKICKHVCILFYTCEPHAYPKTYKHACISFYTCKHTCVPKRLENTSSVYL